ncbi:thiol-disulfide oxidoreductase DCC family protein [Cohnella luojiensis]|nr:thiol-disulfide oxidoreductase DCC family protein [Cohnella luojiensis]
MNAKEPIILLIDGQCNLCHGITRFVIKRDPEAKFRFASLQSELGQRLLQAGGLSKDSLDTVVMIEHGSRYSIKSTAALRLCRKLGGFWPLLYGGIVFPRFIRDRVYDFIASRRYRWFGRQDSCLMPTENIRSRFLEDSWGSKG